MITVLILIAAIPCAHSQQFYNQHLQVDPEYTAGYVQAYDYPNNPAVQYHYNLEYSTIQNLFADMSSEEDRRPHVSRYDHDSDSNSCECDCQECENLKPCCEAFCYSSCNVQRVPVNNGNPSRVAFVPYSYLLPVQNTIQLQPGQSPLSDVNPETLGVLRKHPPPIPATYQQPPPIQTREQSLPSTIAQRSRLLSKLGQRKSIFKTNQAITTNPSNSTTIKPRDAVWTAIEKLGKAYYYPDSSHNFDSNFYELLGTNQKFRQKASAFHRKSNRKSFKESVEKHENALQHLQQAISEQYSLLLPAKNPILDVSPGVNPETIVLRERPPPIPTTNQQPPPTPTQEQRLSSTIRRSRPLSKLRQRKSSLKIIKTRTTKEPATTTTPTTTTQRPITTNPAKTTTKTKPSPSTTSEPRSLSTIPPRPRPLSKLIQHKSTLKIKKPKKIRTTTEPATTTTPTTTTLRPITTNPTKTTTKPKPPTPTTTSEPRSPSTIPPRLRPISKLSQRKSILKIIKTKKIRTTTEPATTTTPTKTTQRPITTKPTKTTTKPKPPTPTTTSEPRSPSTIPPRPRPISKLSQRKSILKTKKTRTYFYDQESTKNPVATTKRTTIIQRPILAKLKTTTTRRPTSTKRPTTTKRHISTKRPTTTQRPTTTKRSTSPNRPIKTKRPTTTKHPKISTNQQIATKPSNTTTINPRDVGWNVTKKHGKTYYYPVSSNKFDTDFYELLGTNGKFRQKASFLNRIGKSYKKWEDTHGNKKSDEQLLNVVRKHLTPWILNITNAKTL